MDVAGRIAASDQQLAGSDRIGVVAGRLGQIQVQPARMERTGALHGALRRRAGDGHHRQPHRSPHVTGQHCVLYVDETPL